jgi:hypothetical protein
MTIHEATRKYEAWLGGHTPLAKADLVFKHREMAGGLFPFLRATFYRWLQLWPAVCSDLARAPSVLAVGDLHVENFGTWRDSEGRLIWGINDFDEAYRMPYTVDLVRLAVSARLAIKGDHLAIMAKGACDAILEGYHAGLKSGGRPFVLSEEHVWLRKIAAGKERDPVLFWKKMTALKPATGPVPVSAVKAIEHLMPEPGLSYRLVRRVSGLGSLGRQRFVALADWRGGQVAREAKALVPSAYLWASNNKGSDAILYQTVLDQAVRCRDPFVHFQDGWIVRRLSPYCSRIELVSLPKQRDEYRLLHAMGWETANVHLGSKPAVKAVLRDLDKRPSAWLRSATKAMAKASIKDWEEWTRK